MRVDDRNYQTSK